jgi:hypothetical protein
MRLVKPRIGRRVVDGEVFDVQPMDEDPGSFSCDWLSGPNPDYGFSIGHPVVGVPVGQAPPAETGLTEAGLIQAIRDFLASVDPETGYIE